MNKQEEEILKKFNELRPVLLEWGSHVDDILLNTILKDMIENHLIKILPDCRIKDDNSFLVKALYRKKNYINPLEQIEDKIGTRVVVLKSDDIKIVQEKVMAYEGWTAKLTKDLNQEIEDKPNIFDYQSSHIVVYPRVEKFKYSDENARLLTCEIQIRTLLQHAFAEVSHDSTYKGPYKNDKEILRKLAKAMALMEATDDYFCGIFTIMSDEKRKYALFLNELINIFIGFNSSFSKVDLNLNLTEQVFELLEEMPVKISDLNTFSIRHKDEINKYLETEKGLIFHQPIILLIMYYFYNHRTFLKEKWPLNIEVLKFIYRVTGTSFENY